MSGVTWVYIMLGLYIIYCFYIGLKGFFPDKNIRGLCRCRPIHSLYRICLMAASAASFSGWTFIGHPGAIWAAGLVYAFCSMYVVVIPMTGTFFCQAQLAAGQNATGSSPRAICTLTISTAKHCAGSRY